MTLEGRNQGLCNSVEVTSSFQTGLAPRGVEAGDNFEGAEENSSRLLSVSLHFSSLFPRSCSSCSPSTCGSVGSGSFVEKAICDFSYQSQGVWEPAIPEFGRKKTKNKPTTTTHNKREPCRKSEKTEQMGQKPQSAEGIRPRHQEDLTARQQFWLQQGTYAGLPPSPRGPKPQACPQTTPLVSKGLKIFCAKVLNLTKSLWSHWPRAQVAYQ